MGLTSDIIGIVVKSVFANKVQSELGNDLFGITIDDSLEKSVNVIYDFINSEKSKIKQVLSKESMKLMNISEDKIDFVTEEIKELLLKVEITEEVFRQCKYNDKDLKEYLWNEYNKSKNDYIECENDIKKGLNIISKALINLEKERDDFEKKLLININGSVNDINKELQIISTYLEGRFGSLDTSNQAILDLLRIILKQIQNTNNNQKKIISRTSQYIDIWNENMFLNNFNRRDRNPGVNVKLRDVYLEKHLPHYKWNDNDKLFEDIRLLLNEFINENDNKQMLLILGQPGIGKSTLITWIVANYTKMVDKILVYQFASDLKDIEWQNTSSTYNIANEIVKILNLTYDDLEDKILIFDGFDEINVGDDRAKVINQLYRKFKRSRLKNFSLIITCRENYIQKLNEVGCNYIILQSWNEKQIKSFCKVYTEKVGTIISDDTMNNILRNNEILGIPLILYMVLALNISIDKEGSIADVYDKIFSLEGGIYDRCIENSSFADFHRIGKIKEQIHQITSEIAMWIFENNSEETYISKEEYEEICNKVIQEQIENENSKKDFMIGNYFKLVRYCDGIGTEELYFVHRSIYEYFVAEYIYTRICKVINKEKEDLAEELGKLLKLGYLSEEICGFLKYKIENRELKEKFNIVNETFRLMQQNGMTYYTKEYYKNVIDCEMAVFANMLQIVHLWENNCFRYSNSICRYLINNRYLNLNLRNVQMQPKEIFSDPEIFEEIHLEGVYLREADLREANLSGVNLTRVDLSRGDLTKAILIGVGFKMANLEMADLERANLKMANLKGADLERANLKGADLERANLEMANLKMANLKGADLEMANLKGADLERANLEMANLEGTNLEGANLTEVNLTEADLTDSFWCKNDILKIFLQLKKANFTYIIIENQNMRQKLYKNELFSNEKWII